jgi:multidrug resistance efflux pump
MRLRRRPRFDTLQNEVRKRGRSWGRWVYLALVLGLALWLLDSFLGDYIYLRAEGLVLRERVVLATQYPAAVVKLNVRQGWNVRPGKVVARLRSQYIEESLAKLHAQLAGVVTSAAELSIRDKVNDALYPLAQNRYQIARNARINSEGLLSQGLLAVNRHSELVKDEVMSAESRAQLAAERDVIGREAADVRAAIDASQSAISRLTELYGDGVIRSPVDGIVGSLEVSEGSVVREAEPLMEIFTGPPFVLAYVPEGTLYDVQKGDHIRIGVGLASYYGQVGQIYNLAGQLPKEFQQAFQPVNRARLIRVEFDPDQRDLPPLFAKTRLSAVGWLPAWLRRLVLYHLPLSTSSPAKEFSQCDRCSFTSAAKPENRDGS